MASEGKGRKRSRDSSAMQWLEPPSKQAEAKMENQEVRRLKSKRLSRFTLGLTQRFLDVRGVLFLGAQNSASLAAAAAGGSEGSATQPASILIT